MKRLLFVATLVFLTVSAFSQKAPAPIKADLWTNGSAPNSNGDVKDTAQVYIYLAPQNHNTGRAIVICPGGGYQHLSMKNEGHDWAEFFQGQGITAVVLKYRMPHKHPEVPISDAEAAMKLVRLNAANWGVKTDQVGIMGFSAGGHLASTIATKSKGDAKPNFQILFYPVISMIEGITHQGSLENLLGKRASKKMQKQYSSDIQVSRVTPRAFICLADDDHAVLPANSISYYTELYKHDVPVTFHTYPRGGHGFGFRQSFANHIEMVLELKSWLNSF
ncbi:MAG: alpha/beta hydrolase [Bacteroidaceae bacterium]|nr:alpha/beta hydrolase [Bacteroidaceae bacterium]